MIQKFLQKIIKVLNIAILVGIAIIILYNLIFNTFKFKRSNYLFESKNIKIVKMPDDIMEPDFKKGDVLVFKKTIKEDLKVNDIVYINESNQEKVSKISRINNEEELATKYLTKGNKNLYYNYEEIEFDKIIGKFDHKLGFWGFILKIITSKILLAINILFIVYLIILNEKRIKRSKERRNKKIKYKKN